jgi:hypothetical protein
MSKIKTNDTSKLDRAKIENRVLADSELDAVSGGWLPSGIQGAEMYIPRSPMDPLINTAGRNC